MFEKYSDTKNDDVERVKLLLNAETYSEVYNAFKDLKFMDLPRIDKEFIKSDTAESFKKARQTFKKSIESVKGFSMSPESVAEFFKLQKPVIKALINIVSEFTEIFYTAKLEKNVLEFSDLSHLAIKLLVDENGNPTETAIDIADNYDEIIIDEYQDTNYIQELILTSVSKNKSNIFMVGDMKQSIYKFRNTAPELFLNKVKSFTDDGTENGKKIYLSENFRSRKNILDFTNLVFEQTMSQETGEILYAEKEKLNNGATYYEGNDTETDVIIMDKPSSDTDTDYIQSEAIQTATEINRLIESKLQVFDKKLKANRPVKYSDIAILLRASKNITEPFADTLTSCGIPVYNDSNNIVLSNTSEVQVILNFLRIIDNPLQNIPFISVLKSFMFDFDENLLIKIRKSSDDFYFYDSLLKYCGTDQETEKINNFITALQELTYESKILKVSELIDKIDTCYN